MAQFASSTPTGASASSSSSVAAPSASASASSGGEPATTEIQTLLGKFDALINQMMDYPAKDIINSLTMLAERVQFAPEIVSFLETKIHRVNNQLPCRGASLLAACGLPSAPCCLVAPNCKLPIFYLTDSILKNIRGPYPSLFAAKIVPLYCNCVRQVRARRWVSAKDLRRFIHVLNTWETTRLFNKEAIAQMRGAATRAQAAAESSSAPGKPVQQRPPPQQQQQQQTHGRGGSSSMKLAQQQQDMELRSLLTKLQNDMNIHPTEHMSLEEVRTNNPDYYNQLLEFHAASKVEQTSAATRGSSAGGVLPHPAADQQQQQPPPVRDPRRPSPAQDPRAQVARPPRSEGSSAKSANVAHLMQLLKRKQRAPPSPSRQAAQEAAEITNDPPRAPNAAAVMSILQKLKGMSQTEGGAPPGPPPPPPQRLQQEQRPPQQQQAPSHDNASRMWFSDKIVAHKDRVESNVQKLYAALPLVCRESGLRFREQAQLNAHLDFLFQYNRSRKEHGKGGVSRSWYPDADQWVADFSGDTAPRESTSSSFFDRTQKESEKNAGEQASWESARVPVDDSITRCRICGENFTKSWEEDEEDWMYTNAVAATIHNTGVNGDEQQETIFHKYCYDTVMTNSKQITPAHLIPAERDATAKEAGDSDSSMSGSTGVKRPIEEVCEDESDSDGDDVKRVKTA
ncbi:hypothetical protein BBJ28_00000734 [Nothophytophthora sp. Chile5]|nr:hypothetical protein BBJ28_00000734 [Nothophytophthora sp. Chile5]